VLEGHTGAIVVLDVRDGSVLALASRPTFAPPAPAADAERAHTNRATEGTYPVASLFKVVAMAAGLDSGEYDPASPFRCNGAWNAWDAVELASGHGGREATPLQLARLYAALATDGILRQPVLVRRIVDVDDRVLWTQDGATQGRLPVSDAHREAIQDAMRAV